MERKDGSQAHIAKLEKELRALQSREQDLTDFIENASIGLHWVGPDGTILWANQCELELLGYERDEYVGHNIAEFHADAVVIEDILHRLVNNETLKSYEARLRAKSGAIRHVQISSNVRWSATGEFLHTRCFTRDVTTPRNYELRLLAQYGVGHALSTATSLESVAPVILELIGRHLDWTAGMLWLPREGRLHCAASWTDAPGGGGRFHEACNGVRFAPGTGFPGRVWQQKTVQWIADVRQDDSLPRLQAMAEEGFLCAFGFPVISSGEVLAVVEFFGRETRTADGDLLQVASSMGFQIGEFIERKQAEQKLAEREEGYRVLTETASDGIVTIDAEGAILFANTAAAAMFGYTREELRTVNAAVLMPEEERTRHHGSIFEYVKAARRHPQACHAIPVEGQHRHGHQIPIEISFGEYKQSGRHLFVGVLRDVTDRKRLEESMRQAAKLESLGVLAGGIAHDFNNLLTGILGNVSLAAETLTAGDSLLPILNNAIEASERAADLTRQMLAYAGKGRIIVEPVNISTLIRQISSLVQSSIPRHVTLRLDLDDSLPLVHGDAAQLQQLFMNLIINGAEAIPEERVGRLLLSTRYRSVEARETKEFVAGEVEPGDYVAITVSDNGSGIDPATMSRIFDPFFTTKFTGRGLGLAAALGIVRGHKGALRVFSLPGEGTTFGVFLPPSGAVAKPPTLAVTAPGMSHEVTSGTVLVVDDEPVVLKLAVPTLSRCGYMVVTADNGRTGVERFREFHGQLSIVILDMTMPIMNGEQALSQMVAIDPAVPVVLSSGYNESEATERFKGKGLAGFLQKPYAVKDLAEKVRSLARKT